MSGEWQLVIVGLIVAVAAGYLVRRSWRSWRSSGEGCGGSCSCGSKKSDEKVHFVAADQLTLRLSKRNQRPHE